MASDPGASDFGRLLREFRVNAGLTQEELAERAGLGRRSIQGLERGENQPHHHTVQRLATALNLKESERTQLEAAARRAIPPRLEPARPVKPHEIPAPRHNLPIQLTSFVGRERELAETTGLLSKSRLVTLTGTGGCGKTRLALEVAGGLTEAYADGVRLVEFAALSDPALVPTTTAVTLGMREETGEPILDRLLRHLQRRQLLLVADNCEHLVDACAHLADVLLGSGREVPRGRG